MMAMVSAVAARVGESAFARWWRKAGVMLDRAIPIALVVGIVVALGSIWLGYVPAG
jgi:hypothetical protein